MVLRHAVLVWGNYHSRQGEKSQIWLYGLFIYIYICLNIPWRVSLNPQTDWFFKALGVEVQTSSNNTGPAHSCRSATLKESKVTYPKVPENDWKLAPSWHKVSRTVLQQGFKLPAWGLGASYTWTALHKVTNWLVVSTPLKNFSQLGWLFPIYGKIKKGSKPPTSKPMYSEQWTSLRA